MSLEMKGRLNWGRGSSDPSWFTIRVLVLLDLLTHLKNAVKDSFFQMGHIGSISRRGAHSGVLPIQAFLRNTASGLIGHGSVIQEYAAFLQNASIIELPYPGFHPGLVYGAPLGR